MVLEGDTFCVCMCMGSIAVIPVNTGRFGGCVVPLLQILALYSHNASVCFTEFADIAIILYQTESVQWSYVLLYTSMHSKKLC